MNEPENKKPSFFTPMKKRLLVNLILSFTSVFLIYLFFVLSPHIGELFEGRKVKKLDRSEKGLNC
jgi:hypothetical protein